MRPIMLVLIPMVVAAPAAAHDRWHPHPWPPHPPGKVKDKPTTAAPGTTAAPATTDAPATTAAPAPTAAPVVPAGPAVAPPAPDLGQSVALAAVSGTVKVRVPGGTTQALTAATELPTGTRVDTRAGTVDLTSALDANGTTQTGRFWGGVFEVRQPKSGKGLTQLVLVGGDWSRCRTGAYVSRSAKRKKARKPVRTLWGSDDHGRFQTRGGGSVATVRGTRWLTSDTCNGTRTSVVEGAVDVKSRKTGKTHRVTAGHTVFIHR